MTIDEILDKMDSEKSVGLGVGAAALGGFIDPTKASERAAGKYSFAIRHKNDRTPVPGAAKDIPEQVLHGRKIVAINEPGLSITPKMAERYGMVGHIPGIPPNVRERLARSSAAHLPVGLLQRLVPPTAFQDLKNVRAGDIVSAPNLQKASPELETMKLDIKQLYPGRKKPTSGEYFPGTGQGWASIEPLGEPMSEAGTVQHEIRGHGADDLLGLLRSRDPKLQEMIELMARGDAKLRAHLEDMAYRYQSDEVAGRAVEKGYMSPEQLKMGKHIEGDLAYDVAEPGSKRAIIDAMRDKANRHFAGVAEPPKPFAAGSKDSLDASKEIIQKAVQESKNKGVMYGIKLEDLETPSFTQQMEALKKAGVGQSRAWETMRTAFAADAAAAQGVPISAQAAESANSAKALIKAAFSRAGVSKGLDAALDIIKAIR